MAKIWFQALERNVNDIKLDLKQIKEIFTLIVRSPYDITFEDKATKKLWVAGFMETQNVLNALGIKIENNAPLTKSKKTHKKRGNSVVVGGNITGSNVVKGNDNKVANACNGVSYITIGDNLFVGPK